jgi:outer membrane protein OmpA-like peptidoglycan-associated protein
MLNELNLNNMKFQKITFIVLMSIQTLFAQKEANTWYFGTKAGVEFVDGVPKALKNGMLSTEEGCTVISNEKGNLLFYSDGITVWNASHKVMPNGKDLKGHPSSTQSGVAIPLPNQKGKYILFTVCETAKPDGLRYSVIDMSLDGGMGDVLADKKNIVLKTPVTEKLTAVKHRNGKDFWVISHGWKNNEFYAYLVTENGVQVSPIISAVGKVHEGKELNTQGYMKSNPDGSNLALALEEIDVFELFDFDNKTGIVSNPITLKLPQNSFPYGVEFSPDGSVFYGSAAGTGEIYQFDLQAGSIEAIQESGRVVGKSPNKEWIGALQLASNGKIYFGIYKKPILGHIEFPNSVGAACMVNTNVVNLEGNNATLGLPTFTQSFFTQEFNINIQAFNDKNVKTGERYVLKNIQFDFAKYTLQSSSTAELNRLLNVLKSKPKYTIEIHGHTDNIGNKSANILLSENRALEVKKYLVKNGIAEARIQTRGFGSANPITSNETDEGRGRNRRVEFIMYE